MARSRKPKVSDNTQHATVSPTPPLDDSQSNSRVFKIRCIHGPKWLFERKRFFTLAWEIVDDLSDEELAIWMQDKRVEIVEVA